MDDGGNVRAVYSVFIVLILLVSSLAGISLLSHSAPSNASSRLTTSDYTGSWSTACGSNVDPNASPCVPGAPFLCPAYVGIYPSCYGFSIASTTVPYDQGFIQLDEYNVRHGAYPSYFYEGPYYNLWVYYEGVWFNWTSTSGIQSQIDSLISTSGCALGVGTGCTSVSSVTATFDAYDYFYLAVATENYTCGYNPSFPPCDFEVPDNVTSNVTFFAAAVTLPFFSFAALSFVTTYPGIILYTPTSKTACEDQVYSAADQTIGYVVTSFFGYGCNASGLWFESQGGSTVNVTSALDPSQVFASAPANDTPQGLAFDGADGSLLAMNSTGNVFMLNGSGPWALTNLVFPTSSWPDVYLSGPASTGAYSSLGTLFFSENVHTHALTIYLFSYAYFNGFQLLNITGPKPPGSVWGQGGIYGSYGIITRMKYGPNWNNGTYLLTITPVLPPAPTDLVAAIVNVSDIFYTWTQATGGGLIANIFYLYSGAGCVNFFTNVYQSPAITALDYGGLSPNTTYSARVTAVNNTGEGPPSNCVTSTTPLTPPTPPPSPTIWNIEESGTGYVVVTVIYPYHSCGPDCNIYNLINLTVYYNASTSPLLTASWIDVYHFPPWYNNLNWGSLTALYIPGLANNTTYSFYATVWNSTLQSAPSSTVSFTTSSSCQLSVFGCFSNFTYPVTPRVSKNVTLPSRNATLSTNPLTFFVSLYLSPYRLGTNGYYFATASWTNNLVNVSGAVFILQASWIDDATNISVTANGITLTHVTQFGVGDNAIFIFPGVVNLTHNFSVGFQVQFNYVASLPTGLITFNGQVLQLSQLFTFVSLILLAAVSYLSFVMRRTSYLSVLAFLALLLTVGVELFG